MQAVTISHDPPRRTAVRGDGTPWRAVEHVRGIRLASLMASGRRLSTDAACKLMVGLCRDLDALHRVGLVHRDVSPDTILLTRADRQVRLAAGLVVGTPAYMAPEQISDLLVERAARRTSPASNVYALGLILFALLTGRRAFEEAPVSCLQARYTWLSRRDFAPPAQPRCIDGALWSVIRKALRADPAARQQTAAQLSMDLRRYALSGLGVDDAPPEDSVVEPDADRVIALSQGRLHADIFRPTTPPRRHGRSASRLALAATLCVVGGVATGLLLLAPV